MASLVDCSTFPSLSQVSGDADGRLPKNIMTLSALPVDSDDDVPVDMETTCPGLGFTKKQEKFIKRKWLHWYINACAEHSRSCNELLRKGIKDFSSLTPPPLKVLPKTTESCIQRGYCYHREYMTNETYETSQNLGSDIPNQMLQVLSLRLSHTESCPVSVYGICAIRDDLEPLRNYVFNRTRDDPVMIDKDSFALPLCSPCRGIYALDRVLLEVDLWIKTEGDDRSTDEQLLSEYVEIELRICSERKVIGRIYGNRCMLDMGYMFLAMSVAEIIQVSVLADNPSHVRFIAFSSCFDDEIILFKGKGVVKGEVIRHVVAVKPEEKLGVRLELGDSVFEWCFQDGVFSSPADNWITNQFDVKVFFAPDNPAPLRDMRYDDWKRRCRVQKISGKHPVLDKP